ncbi:aldehyde oxidase GLOX1-like [Durio zibethinus]|uniref:Aldehyde oxidase GLOX1-like n=1 Tax=Durio zibethinus TaxID=66656 RepID=A0A6P5ZGQ7_DURZI|nr:aldehyde oxidase GLOX1-like [Durio zibethinus]
MVMLWRGLYILPLLFVSGNCQFLFPFLHHFNKPIHSNHVGGGGYIEPNAGGFFPVDGGFAAKGGDDNLESFKIDDGSADQKKKKGNANVSVETKYKGKWKLFTQNAGVSAMHLILLPKIDQALMFDATVWKQSKLKLPGPPCRQVEGTNEQDCFCHSVLLDIETAKIRPLRLKYDTWCSSGALDVNGRLISTGGYNNGSDTVRILDICPNCDWQEYPGALGNGRWYATQVTLGDGRFMVFGGRNFPTYEFVPPEGQRNAKNQVFPFKFLAETHDAVENNLYPFVYLSTDGNLFIFANNRSILLNPKTQQILHEFPVLPGGARNYPASGSSCLLPIALQPYETRKLIPAEVLICGGTSHEAFAQADLKRPKVFVPANKDCARIDITKRNGKWKIQTMPSPRLMGDAVVLPTGDVLLINGAQSGSAGWDDARDPNFTPVLYRVRGGAGSKFTELKPSQIARLYHSSFALLPDGKILIAGSNTNPGYIDSALFPTEVRVEKFSPHYFDPNLNKFRLEIVLDKSANQIKYGNRFTVQIRGADKALDEQKLQVNIYYPAFTTHGISMNQRLVQLGTIQVIKNVAPETHNIILQAPIHGNIAPPGYYMLFVNYNGVPCRRAMWVQMLP